MNISPGFCTVGLLYTVYCFEEEKHTPIEKNIWRQREDKEVKENDYIFIITS